MHRVALTHLVIIGIADLILILPAYVLPDPLDLRVQVTEETGTETPEHFVRGFLKLSAHPVVV